jgi:hypothetical protein
MEMAARLTFLFVVLDLTALSCRNNVPSAAYQAPTDYFLSTKNLDSARMQLHDSSFLTVSDIGKRSGASSSVAKPTILPASLESDGNIYYSYSVPAGKVQSLHWSDGFHAILDARTTLKFSDKSPEGGRTFVLDGRAELTGNPHHSNVIRLPSLVSIMTSDQTIFIDGFGDQHREYIIAYGGKVKVRGEHYVVDLMSNAGLEILADQSYKRLPGFYTPPADHWSQSFQFTDITAAGMACELSRWFAQSVEVIGGDSTARYTMGALSRSIPLDSLCSRIAAISGIHLVPRRSKSMKIH